MSSGIKVKDIMVKRLIVAHPEDSVKDVASLMKKEKVGSVIIIEGDKAKGIVTERDLVRKIVAEGKSYSTKIKEVMSSPLIVIHELSSIEDAAKIMRDSNIKRLPVVNNQGSVVGIITENDILKIFPSIVDLIELKAKLEEVE